MLLGIGIAGAVYTTSLAAFGGGDQPEQILAATGVGLLVASAMAAVGIVTSATRPSAQPPRE
jgi:hypothetical protein